MTSAQGDHGDHTMPFKTTLLGGAAITLALAAGLADTASATVTHTRHNHAVAQAGPSAADIKALTDEVAALKSSLAEERQAREALQALVRADETQAQVDAEASRRQLATQIQTIPSEVDAAVASVKPKPSWTDNTQVHATVFTDLSNIDQTPNLSGHPATKDGAGFDIKRAYFGVEHQFNDVYSANLTVDLAPQDASQTLGGASVNQGAEAIKFAYIQAAYAKAFVVQVGAERTPWISLADDFYGYRFIDKTVTDQNKLANSSDWGVNAHGDLAGGLFQYSVSAEDGQGYKNPDRSKTLDLEGRVNVNWNGFVAAIGGYDGKLAADIQAAPSLPIVRTATREDALVGYSNNQFRVGAEWFDAKNALTSGALITGAKPDEADGYSLTGAFNVTPQWSLFARYDAVNPSKDLDPAERYKYYNFGINYEPVKIVDLALVYKHEEVSHALSGGYTDITTTLAPTGGSGKFDEVGLYSQFKF